MATEIDLARQLLRRARDDEVAAKAMLPVESVTDAIVGFHAQQAVEKSLKAVLAARGAGFPFSHDVGRLAELCEEAGSELPDGLDGVERLTPYASGLRYGDDGTMDVDRETALRWTGLAVEWARGQVEPESEEPVESADA
jgi:HEPN domain-containing protein